MSAVPIMPFVRNIRMATARSSKRHPLVPSGPVRWPLPARSPATFRSRTKKGGQDGATHGGSHPGHEALAPRSPQLAKLLPRQSPGQRCLDERRLVRAGELSNRGEWRCHHRFRLRQPFALEPLSQDDGPSERKVPRTRKAPPLGGMAQANRLDPRRSQSDLPARREGTALWLAVAANCA